jgi:hypothetical protein
MKNAAKSREGGRHTNISSDKHIFRKWTTLLRTLFGQEESLLFAESAPDMVVSASFTDAWI